MNAFDRIRSAQAAERDAIPYADRNMNGVSLCVTTASGDRIKFVLGDQSLALSEAQAKWVHQTLGKLLAEESEASHG
jgi:hypothetical protein